MDYFERHKGGKRALLVHVQVYILPDLDLEEFKLLADSAGAEVVEVITASRSRPDAQYFIGAGKAEEIADRVKNLEIDVLIVDHSLTPAQERNLEKICECMVMDRTRLILDIFALRARTYEGQLQVELAQLNHLSSRLVRGWTHLERQKGGIGMRGPGETQLETDRRLLRIRVGQLQERLQKVRQTRQQGRASRQKADIRTVSLVGYTNAGKSTLFNALCNSDVYAADQLFATLDPTLRQIQWPGLGEVIVADTVGFVQHLPHALVDAFRATLEETLEADLILHVIDASSPECQEQMHAVKAVLAEIGCYVPVLEVYNKIDLTGDAPLSVTGSSGTIEKVRVSAKTRVGIKALYTAVAQALAGDSLSFDVHLPPSEHKLRAQLIALKVVTQESIYDNGDIGLRLMISPSKLKRLLIQAGIMPELVLPEEQAAELATAKEWFEMPVIPPTTVE